MPEPLESPLSFSDSELDCYIRTGDSLTVRIRGWDGTTLAVVFRNVIGQRDVLAGDFSAAVRGAATSQAFLQAVLSKHYVEVPASPAFDVYSFLNLDDEPSLEVVAASYTVSID